MSYILDALRKSDQQRQRGAAPTLLTALATRGALSPPARLRYGLLALALVGAGVAVGWLRPWQPEQAAPVVRLAAKPPPSQPLPVPTAPVPKSEPQAPLPSAVPAPPVAPLAAPSKRRTPHQATTDVSQKPAPEKRVDTESAAVAPEQSAIAMAELPLSIQQELPAMSIMVHAYSDKSAERLVGINNRLLHEGDEIAPGLKLEKIIPDGMILSYRGHRFRRGVH